MSTTTLTSADKVEGEGSVFNSKDISEGKVDTTESSVRYLAYLARLRTVVVAGSRYLAYTSDVGEAFRPIVSPKLVTGAYAVSWMYLVGDVSYEGYKASLNYPGETGLISALIGRRAIFQSVASMGLPAVTIHTVVRVANQTQIFAKMTKNARIRAWGPTVSGLAIVPFLPFMFDEPVEHVVDAVWAQVATRAGWQKQLEHERLEKELKEEHKKAAHLAKEKQE